MSQAFDQACRASSASDYYIPGDGHWSVKGHALAASLIEQYLVLHGILPAETKSTVS